MSVTSWIGTARDLFRLDLFIENWRRYGRLGTQDIRAIATNRDQETVWVASWSSGLHGLKQQTELEATPKVSEPILALTAGTSQCWAVGLDGLYQYKDSDWVQVISAKELPVRGWLQAVAQAVTDRVWLGTSAGLLVYSHLAPFSTRPEKPGLLTNNQAFRLQQSQETRFLALVQDLSLQT